MTARIPRQSPQKPSRRIFRRPANAVLCLLQACLVLLAGCQAASGSSPAAPARSFSGNGPGEARLADWQGPGILHITAPAGSQPFHAQANSGLDSLELVPSTAGAVDEYRGIAADPGASMTISIQGDRAWKVDLFPVGTQGFERLPIPGTYQGQGSAVILMQAKPGVATFEKDKAERFEAWAMGKRQKWERLTITENGDYKGKSVLPIETTAIIISAKGPWSVSILKPCCDNIPEKPKQ